MAGENSWQPIESAPRDGFILGYQATDGDNQGRMEVCYKWGTIWTASSGIIATHWQPLPEPPERP